MRDDKVLWDSVVGLLPLLMTLYTNLSMGFELWIKVGATRKRTVRQRWLPWFVDKTLAFHFRDFLFRWLPTCCEQRRFLSQKERLAEPINGNDSSALSLRGPLRISLIYPELFTAHLLCPQGTRERRENGCLFSIIICAEVKFKYRHGDNALVANTLPCWGMWKIN